MAGSRKHAGSFVVLYIECRGVANFREEHGADRGSVSVARGIPDTGGGVSVVFVVDYVCVGDCLVDDGGIFFVGVGFVFFFGEEKRRIVSSEAALSYTTPVFSDS